MARTIPPAYGRTARFLHWLTFLLVTAQFTLGYLLDDGGHGRGRGRGRGGASGRGRGRGGEDDVWDRLAEEPLLVAHVALGLTIVTVTIVRLAWRSHAGLPEWASTLSARERTFAHWTERALYALLLLVPATGLVLVFVSDDALPLHVAAHLAFFAALACHLGLVLKHQLVDRDHLVRRML